MEMTQTFILAKYDIVLAKRMCVHTMWTLPHSLGHTKRTEKEMLRQIKKTENRVDVSIVMSNVIKCDTAVGYDD